MKTVILNAKREYSVVHRHPWIFSGAVHQVEGEPAPGETVRVVGSDGSVLGVGAYSPQSQIRVRMWSFEEVDVGAEFIRNRIAASIGRRARLIGEQVSDAMRLVNAESDGIPGLVADRYGDWIVCQFTAVAAEHWKAEIIEALKTFSPCKGIYERSDVEIREREGLPLLTGVMWGEPPPERIEIVEHGSRFLVDVKCGHKTGFYLDQRDNRALVRDHANGCDVLNAFSYTGGFGVAAVSAGATSVTHVDLSESALALARENTALNTCHVEDSTFLHGNVFEVLRKFRDARRTFDLVILDPPKFADAKGHMLKAARGYKDINLLGMKLLRPGGMLATFSCSGLMTPELFHSLVVEAAVDAKRDMQVVKRLQQAEDHPEGLCFPEGLYLKGFFCRLT